MSNQEKIEALKSWLTENKVKYQEDVVHAGKGIHIDLYLPKYLIAVHVGDDSEFFQEVKNTCILYSFATRTRLSS